jgi:hypothetical protein
VFAFDDIAAPVSAGLAVPAGGRAFDPLELLAGHGDVVVHRLNDARVVTLSRRTWS